jgi:hypothetical protein
LAAWLGQLIQSERRRSFSIAYYNGAEFGGRPVSSNRNRILRDRPPGCDVLMLDADTIPDWRLFDITLAGLDVVIAPVPIYRADSPDGPVIINLVSEIGAHVETGIPEFVEVLEGGAGALYISSAVIDALPPGPFRFAYDADGVMEVGEDHGFCRLARTHGFKIHAALGYLCGHAVEVNLKTVVDALPSVDAGTRRLAVVVTGTGRSGTGYAAQWLTSAGIPCGHETFFYFRGLEGAATRLRRYPELVAEASWMAAPYLECPQLKDALVVHQVRHPKSVIESCVRHPPGTTPAYLAFLEHHCPEVAVWPDTLNKAAARWIHWNRYIEERTNGRPVFVWRVEDGEDGLLDFLHGHRLLDKDRLDRDVLFDDTTYNSHRPDAPASVTLADIAPELREPLLELCNRYDYEWED